MLVNYSDSEDDQKQNDSLENNNKMQFQIMQPKLIPIEPYIIKKRKPNPKEYNIPNAFLKSDGKIDQEINQQKVQGNKFIPRQLICKQSNVSIE